MQTDQSTEANFRKADFIFAPAVAGITAANSADKPLVFAHRTAKVTVILSAGEGTSAEDLNAAIVTFFGYTAGTVNTGNGSIAGSANGRITALRNGAAHTALLIPQNMTTDADFIGVTVNGNNYFHKLSADETSLEAGKSYTYNITLTQGEPPEYDVYLTGQNGQNQIGYRKNGVWKNIEGSASVTQIIANGNDLYMLTGNGRLWKNGANIRTDFHGDRIAVAGNDVYSAETHSSLTSPSYYKNGANVSLSLPSYTSGSVVHTHADATIYDIATDGNDLVVAGKNYYWKNGVCRAEGNNKSGNIILEETGVSRVEGVDMIMQDVTTETEYAYIDGVFTPITVTSGYQWTGTEGYHFSKIAVSNGTVYILPDAEHTYYYQYAPNWSGTAQTCHLVYWKNDEAGDHIVRVEYLEVPYPAWIGQPATGYMNDIFVVNDDVYIAGTLLLDGTTGDAVYWKNQEKIVLPKQEYARAEAKTIYVFNDDVFVTGHLGDSGSGKDVVWKNGEIILEGSDSSNITFDGIAILPHDPARTW
jgi:hypothetical protein